MVDDLRSSDRAREVLRDLVDRAMREAWDVKPRSLDVLRWRWGLDGTHQTRYYVAHRLGISLPRVTQIERATIKALCNRAGIHPFLLHHAMTS